MNKKQVLDLIRKMADKADWIDRSMDALAELIKAKEYDFARAFLDAFMYKLDTQDNVLLTTENNKRLLASIDRIYANLKSDITTGIVSRLVKDVNHIIAENAAFYGRMSSMSTPLFNTTANNIKDIIYERLGLDSDGALVKEGYMSGLLDMPEVRNKIRDYSYRGVLTKSGVESFKAGLVDLIAGAAQKLGAFSKYYKTYASDIYSEVDAMNAKIFKDQLGLSYFIYNGGLIKNSRMFCIKRAGRIFSVEETKGWENDPDNNAKQPNYNPLINRGGYGCRHSIDYITEEMAFLLRPDLKFAKEFDQFYKSRTGGKVVVHPKRDDHDFLHNLASAKILADNGFEVKILPHSSEPGVKNPEYVVNGLLSDLKIPKPNSKNGIDNALKGGRRQKVESVVINLSQSGYSNHFVKTELSRLFSNGRKRNVREVILIRGQKVAVINRVELISGWDWVDRLPL